MLKVGLGLCHASWCHKSPKTWRHEDMKIQWPSLSVQEVCETHLAPWILLPGEAEAMSDTWGETFKLPRLIPLWKKSLHVVFIEGSQEGRRRRRPVGSEIRWWKCAHTWGEALTSRSTCFPALTSSTPALLRACAVGLWFWWLTQGKFLIIRLTLCWLTGTILWPQCRITNKTSHTSFKSMCIKMCVCMMVNGGRSTEIFSKVSKVKVAYCLWIPHCKNTSKWY